jgi:hypothetical protein
MGRPLDYGVHRNSYTRDIGEQQTKGSTCFLMLAQVESSVNSVGRWEGNSWFCCLSWTLGCDLVLADAVNQRGVAKIYVTLSLDGAIPCLLI